MCKHTKYIVIIMIVQYSIWILTPGRTALEGCKLAAMVLTAYTAVQSCTGSDTNIHEVARRMWYTNYA